MINLLVTLLWIVADSIVAVLGTLMGLLLSSIFLLIMLVVGCLAIITAR